MKYKIKWIKLNHERDCQYMILSSFGNDYMWVCPNECIWKHSKYGCMPYPEEYNDYIYGIR